MQAAGTNSAMLIGHYTAPTMSAVPTRSKTSLQSPHASAEPQQCLESTQPRLHEQHRSRGPPISTQRQANSQHMAAQMPLPVCNPNIQAQYGLQKSKPAHDPIGTEQHLLSITNVQSSLPTQHVSSHQNPPQQHSPYNMRTLH